MFNEYLNKDKSDGIIVIEHKNEPVTPRALTRERILISVFAPSVRKKKGIAPATVAPVVARRAGNFLRSAKKILNLVFSLRIFKVVRILSTQRTAALTVIPLTAIKAHAIAELYALPASTRQIAGIASDGGIIERTYKGIEKDSLIAANII